MSLAQIDFSKIPAPAVIELLDFETILAAIQADLLARDATLTAVSLESDPIAKLIQACALRELIVRQRVNDAAHAGMLAYAVGSDLDQHAANRETVRLPGETDSAFRARIQQSFNRLAVAGPAAAYIEHARGIDASIVDVSAISQADGEVTVTVLAPEFITTANATPDQLLSGQAAFPSVLPPSGLSVVVAGDNAPLINQVRNWLLQDTIKPLTDVLIVRGATVKPFIIAASLTFYPGPDSAVVIADAHTGLDKYLISIRRMGFDATRSGLIAALSVAGVQRVNLASPTADMIADELSIALATSITLTDGGRNV